MGAIIDGSGGVTRQFWLPSSDQDRTYSIHVDIDRFGWQKFAVEFVPENSGTVQLTLMGPFEPVEPGSNTIFLEEVLWDNIQATGGRVVNGGFESGGASIQGWNGGRPVASNKDIEAVEGSRYARSWHNNGLSTSINVNAGRPVRLNFHARSAVPEGFAELAKPAAIDLPTPAQISRLKFMRGVGLGNYLEAPPNTWGTVVYRASDFALIRGEGFDHVRIPIAWHYHAGGAPSFTLSSAIFADVDFMVNTALANGLGAVLDWHHFDEFTAAPEPFTEKFYRIWEQIAEHYADAPPEVGFELLNEPRDLATTAVMNPIYAGAIQRIRRTNPDRAIFVGPGNFNGVNDLDHLTLPGDDWNLIATVHFYDPIYLTHQGATWVNDVATLGIEFPGPPASPVTPPASVTAPWALDWIESYNTLPSDRNPSSPDVLARRLQKIARWAEHTGRPVYVGEFGCFETAEDETRTAYYQSIREQLDALNLGWAMWDWKAGFHYIKDGAPDPPGMRAAMFPPLRLSSDGPGSITVRAAAGKTLTVLRSDPNGPTFDWRPIATRTLNSPLLEFLDSEAAARSGGLYRVQWQK